MTATIQPLQKTRYLTCAETAKLLRKALKAAFPATRFSVRSHTYAGGASIHVGWTDGPTTKRVDEVAQQFRGATFNGMQDLMEYHTTTWQGEVVHMGADFVFTERKYSAGFLQRVLQAVGDRYHFPTDGWDAGRLDREGDRVFPVGGTDDYFWTLRNVVRRGAEDRTELTR